MIRRSVCLKKNFHIMIIILIDIMVIFSWFIHHDEYYVLNAQYSIQKHTLFSHMCDDSDLDHKHTHTHTLGSIELDSEIDIAVDIGICIFGWLASLHFTSVNILSSLHLKLDLNWPDLTKHEMLLISFLSLNNLVERTDNEYHFILHLFHSFSPIQQSNRIRVFWVLRRKHKTWKLKLLFLKYGRKSLSDSSSHWTGTRGRF